MDAVTECVATDAVCELEAVAADEAVPVVVADCDAVGVAVPVAVGVPDLEAVAVFVFDRVAERVLVPVADTDADSDDDPDADADADCVGDELARAVCEALLLTAAVRVWLTGDCEAEGLPVAEPETVAAEDGDRLGVAALDALTEWVATDAVCELETVAADVAVPVVVGDCDAVGVAVPVAVGVPDLEAVVVRVLDFVAAPEALLVADTDADSDADPDADADADCVEVELARAVRVLLLVTGGVRVKLAGVFEAEGVFVLDPLPVLVPVAEPEAVAAEDGDTLGVAALDAVTEWVATDAVCELETVAADEAVPVVVADCDAVGVAVPVAACVPDLEAVAVRVLDFVAAPEALLVADTDADPDADPDADADADCVEVELARAVRVLLLVTGGVRVWLAGVCEAEGLPEFDALLVRVPVAVPEAVAAIDDDTLGVAGLDGVTECVATDGVRVLEGVATALALAVEAGELDFVPVVVPVVEPVAVWEAVSDGGTEEDAVSDFDADSDADPDPDLDADADTDAVVDAVRVELAVILDVLVMLAVILDVAVLVAVGLDVTDGVPPADWDACNALAILPLRLPGP